MQSLKQLTELDPLHSSLKENENNSLSAGESSTGRVGVP